MPASRFECPRCQTVFVKDIGGDAAFVECPSCGALALPAGGAAEGDLSRAFSGPQPAPPSRAGKRPPDADLASGPPAPAARAGMFSALLDDATHELPASDLPPVASAAPAEQGEFGGVTGSVRAPELDFDFRGLDVELPLPPTSNPGFRKSQVNEASSPFSAVSPSQSGSPPSVHTLTPSAMAALAQDAEAGPTAQGGAPWSSNTLSEEAFGDLEKAFDEMALRPQPAGGGRGNLSFDEERFLRGDDADYSDMRDRPPPRRGGTDRSERTAPAAAKASGQRDAPPLPPGKRPGGPSKAAKRSTHFQLSEEAKRLAFFPLDEASGSSRAYDAAPARSASQAAGERSARNSRHMSGGSPVAVLGVDDVQRGGRGPSTDEDTDLLREKAAGLSERRDRKPVPRVFQGLSPLRVLAIIVVCGVVGGVGGVLTAPPQKTASTPRARAELRFADANRFYDAQRFDDALGAFRGTLSIDPTFALAHRAKGAALAKLNRHDEAATAYEEYLKLEPTAVDATDVKAALVRREGKTSP